MFPFPLQYDPELSSRQFGVELSRLTSEERAVPVLVEKLINYIEMHGLYTEGIYRKSGSTNKIKELRQGLDTGKGWEKNSTWGEKSCSLKVGCKEVGMLHQGKTREQSCLPQLRAVQVMLSHLQPKLGSPIHAFLGAIREKSPSS